MTARREIDRQLRTLREIRNIMNSMKTLAYMETRKLDRFLLAQRRMVETIETMGRDFLSHHSALLTRPMPERRGYVLIGTERGFCGDINDDPVRYLNAQGLSATPESVIVVGDRLARRLEGDVRLASRVAGANATEEVPTVLDELVRAINELQKTRGPLTLDIVYHDHQTDNLMTQPLIPPFINRTGKKCDFAYPALLTLSPKDFFAELLDQYLFSVLHGTLYTSLKAENQRRLQHLDAAIRHLEDKQTELARQSRALRQEEIIEEIEVILLNVAVPRATMGH